MPRKIFISYRRQDSAANALGIGQYLEHEFGRRNVFIDVDMHAGANFLEQRLAECRAMAQTLRLNCSDRKVRAPNTQYYDEKNTLVSMYAPDPAPPMDAPEGSPFGMLVNMACSAPIPNVGGTYEGINEASYKSGGQGGDGNDAMEWSIRHDELPGLRRDNSPSCHDGGQVARVVVCSKVQL